MEETMTVPGNIRKQFDTSVINTTMNTIEEIVKDAQVLEDDPYVPTPDERTLNVVEKIKETSTYYAKEEEVIGGLTNVWEYKKGITPTAVFKDILLVVVSTSITDTELFRGAIMTFYDGAEIPAAENPELYDGFAYELGPGIVVIPPGMSLEGQEVSAGTYISISPEYGPYVVKIVAKSDIFPIQ